MANVRLVLEYDGSGFHGWQAQPAGGGLRTVAGELGNAIATVTGEQVKLLAAGRTDAGAHSLGQTVNFATDLKVDPAELRRSLNGVLPADIAVVAADLAPDDFHARFSARRRRYRYLVENREAHAALLRQRAWHVRRPLDVAAMREAAAALLGRNDLGAFGSDPAGRNTVRNLQQVRIRRVGGAIEGHVLAFELAADAFLYGMVRRIVGFLVEVGLGRRDASDAARVIEGSATANSRVAPAHGLYQLPVDYRVALGAGMKTYSPKASELSAAWYLVDADGQTLGRLASNIAKVLKGKHKPTYTPHVNTGDFVVVINAERVHVTGNKRAAKTYERYSGYPGGLRSRTLEEQLARRPEEPLKEAVRGMLQHNTLGGEMLKRLKVYAGAAHQQQAQQPQPIRFNQKGEIEVIGS